MNELTQAMLAARSRVLDQLLAEQSQDDLTIEDAPVTETPDAHRQRERFGNNRYKPPKSLKRTRAKLAAKSKRINRNKK